MQMVNWVLWDSDCCRVGVQALAKGFDYVRCNPPSNEGAQVEGVHAATAGPPRGVELMPSCTMAQYRGALAVLDEPRSLESLQPVLTIAGHT